MRVIVLLLLSLSLSGCVVALVIFAIKPIIRHTFPKSWQYYIWLVAMLRLIVPFAAGINLVGFIFSSANTYVQSAVLPDERPDAAPVLISPELAITPNDG